MPEEESGPEEQNTAQPAAEGGSADEGSPPEGSGGEPPEPRHAGMAPLLAFVVIGGFIILGLALLMFLAGRQARKLSGLLKQDEPLEVGFLERTDIEGSVSAQRERLRTARDLQGGIELTVDQARLLVAGSLFELPAKPERVGVRLEPAPPARLRMLISIPADGGEGYMNFRATLRFRNTEKGVTVVYSEFKAGGVDMVEQFLMEEAHALSGEGYVLEQWLKPAPRRIEVTEDALILDFSPPPPDEPPEKD